MRVFLVAVVSLVLALPGLSVAGESPSDVFASAAVAYDAGKYTEAALLYDLLLEMGYNSAPVYFNLGNAYFRAGDIGRAIWAYRAAAQRAPRDPDIEANLTVARLAARDRIETVPPGFLQQFWRTVGRFLTVGEGALLVTVVWALFWFGIAIWLVFEPARRLVLPALKLLGTAWLLAALVLAGRYFETHKAVSAVIVAPETTAVSGPGAEFDSVFEGHAGLECVVRGEKNAYVLVELANGRVGWVPETDLRLVPAL